MKWKGYSQIAEIDYQETFAPTASAMQLMQCVVQNNMITHQMDVKTAYLNAPVDCDIYMEQPEGFQKDGQIYAMLSPRFSQNMAKPTEVFKRYTGTMPQIREIRVTIKINRILWLWLGSIF